MTKQKRFVLQEREALEELDNVEEAAKSMQPDMTLIEKHQMDLREVERKINQQQSKISGSGTQKIPSKL